MAKKFTDGAVARVVEGNIESFARMITESYFQTHPNVKEFSPETYASAYYNVFKQSLQTIENQIEMTMKKENEDLASMFK